MEDGKTFHHILDSKTGYPIETDVASLTIVSDLSIDGEIWTTRLFGKPVSFILNEVSSLEGIEAVVINNRGEVFYTKGIEKFIG